MISFFESMKVIIKKNKIKHFKKFDRSPVTSIQSGIRNKNILKKVFFLFTKSLFKKYVQTKKLKVSK